jgi:AraC-like DNA-binding protein
MNFKLSSYFPNITVTAGGAFSISDNTFILLESENHWNIITNKGLVPVNSGTIAIGTKIRLVNPSTEMAFLRCYAFAPIDTATELLPHLIILEGEQKLLATKILSTSISSPNDVEEIELRFGEFFAFCNIVKQPIDDSFDRTNYKSKIDFRLIHINRYIRLHYSEPITLDILANIIGCNAVYLSNTYSKVFKISPMRHLQNVRMRKAKELLAHSNFTIGEITQRVGYVSNSQFSALFKRHYGMTPYECRINHVKSALNSQ